MLRWSGQNANQKVGPDKMPTMEKKSRTKCQPRLAFCLVGILSGWHLVHTPSETTKGGFLPIRRKMWVAPILMHWSPNGAYSAFRHMAPYLHMFNLVIFIYSDDVSVSVSRKMSTFSICVRAWFEVSWDPLCQ